MARLDDLVAEVRDQTLRKKLQAAIADLKRKQRFGLVFEEHIPETTALFGLPVQVGATVQRRDDPGANNLYRVIAVNRKGLATLEPLNGGELATAAAKNLLVVKRFGDAIYPTLTSVGVRRRGPKEKPHHAVINGENFHALQLFVYLYERRVDCIYIDPPYNTGARDWKYNNRYVDKNDSWRHSKWLSMMEKRLRLAKRLLKPDGVLICTIDEHEMNHLGMLLESLFPEYLHYMITIVINPKGREKANFAPVDEFAFYVVPDTGEDQILRAPTGFSPQKGLFQTVLQDTEQDATLELDDHEAAEEADDEDDEEPGEVAPAEMASSEPEWEYRHARRRGGGAESSSYRERRPNQFYPIFINEKERKVVRAGPSIPEDEDPNLNYSPGPLVLAGARGSGRVDGAGGANSFGRVWD